MKPSLLILAAGIGSRFGGFKQMEPVGPHGELLIDYSIHDARKGGFGTIVFVISKKIEPDFKGYMDRMYGPNAGFAYVYQELDKLPIGYAVPEGRIKPWGTGHAVLVGKEAITVPFAVINADDYYGTRSFAVLAAALSKMSNDAKEFVMVGFRLEKTLSEHGFVSRGVCTTANDRLVSIAEHEKIRRSGNTVVFENAAGAVKTIDAKSLVSMNCWGFAPKTLFPMLEKDFAGFMRQRGSEPKAEFYLPTVINNGLVNKEISVRMLDSGEQWFGLTYKEDRDVVREYIKRKIAEGAYPEKLF
jgi:hypothetical protein